MFENLTQREKTLAWVVLSLIPVSLLFVGTMYFINTYGDNNLKIVNLSQQVTDEEEKTLKAAKAAKRLNYYRHISLPSEYVKTADYQTWLLELTKKQGLKNIAIKPQTGSSLKYKNKEIANTQILKLTADSGLEELTDFLHEFYALGTLHRIKLLKITPETKLINGQRIRTGMVGVAIDIELATIADAKKSGVVDFEKMKKPLSQPSAAYREKIVGRNMFGPPNNAPTAEPSLSASYATNSEVKITIRGKDADKNDELQMELLAAGIEGAKLESKSGSRDSVLVIPPFEEGTYEFKVAVKDNGFPAKTTENNFKVVLKTPPNSKPSLVIKPSNPYPTDREIELLIEGTDRDEKDALVYKIVSGVEGAELLTHDEDRNVTLKIPPQDSGKYPFTVSISDGREGSDDKKIEKSFEIVVERLFSHLDETRITSILKEKDGSWFVNVKVRTTGERYRLTIGEFFELEKKKWIVESIDANQVVFKLGDQFITVKPMVPFSSVLEPENVVKLDLP